MSHDLLNAPGIGPFLRWRGARIAMQIPLLLVACAMVLHGWLGPTLAPKNLASVLTWVHYRGALVLVLLVSGNFFCMACPFLLPREASRRLFRPFLRWPARLRNKWPAIGLFVAVLFFYEWFDLWGSPSWTASLIASYFLGALVVDGLFRNASFCKYVCPIGQFSFVASTMSPLEVRVREPQTCVACATKDCIRGTRHPEVPSSIVQRGCELALFQPRKVGNLDCTFCLDCVHACPYDNVGILTRVPGEELMSDPRRSGIGRISGRKDLAALVLVFTFGALLNAFGMVTPVYAVEQWLAGLYGTHHEAPVLGSIFVVALVLEPVALLGIASFVTRRVTGTREGLLSIGTRYAYALIPLGFGVWLAHYGFHFLTGLWTFVPASQGALISAGVPLLGAPRWDLVGLPLGFSQAMGLGLVGLGALGSVLLSFRIAQRDTATRAWLASAPWAALSVLLASAAVWLLTQPMEMRGTVLALG